LNSHGRRFRCSSSTVSMSRHVASWSAMRALRMATEFDGSMRRQIPSDGFQRRRDVRALAPVTQHQLVIRMPRAAAVRRTPNRIAVRTHAPSAPVAVAAVSAGQQRAATTLSRHQICG
jgi:hypothetical protein